MLLQTCFIIYLNTYNWITLNSKSYFTNKPNGHLRYIAYSPIFFVVTVNKLIEVVMETFRIRLQISLVYLTTKPFHKDALTY